MEGGTWSLRKSQENHIDQSRLYSRRCGKKLLREVLMQQQQKEVKNKSRKKVEKIDP